MTQTREKRGIEVGCIYFVIPSDNSAIKIGYTTKPKDRLDTLQRGNHQNLRYEFYIAGSKLDEAILHDRFADFRLHGEWFQNTPEIITFIEELEDTQLSIAIRNAENEGFSLPEAIENSDIVPIWECLDWIDRETGEGPLA